MGAVDVALHHDDEFPDDGCESSVRFRLAGCISIERSVCKSKSLWGCSKRAASSSADTGMDSGMDSGYRLREGTKSAWLEEGAPPACGPARWGGDDGQ